MSTVAVPEQPKALTADDTDNRRDFEAICRLIRRGQGHFVLALVEFDLPRQRDAVLGQLREAFPDLNVVTVALTPPPSDAPRAYHVLDQLNDRVNAASPDKAPDALIITGYETLFPENLDATDGRSIEQLKRAIQPLNLGRNILAETFPCPVLLCLPPDAMGVFLRSAPDLSSWRSGFFQFHSDLNQVRAELIQAAQGSLGWWARWRLRRRKPEDLHEEAQRLEALLADAEALPADQSVTARLYERLGWVSAALGNRTQARWAFSEMLRLARKADDRRLVRAAERGQQAAERVTPRARISLEQTPAAQQVFRGAAALTEAEGLYGREEELRRLLGQVAYVGTRFLTVWGETGCGKTSLVQAGLAPELKRLGHFLPVIVYRWDDPELNVRRALEQVSGLPPESIASLASSASLHDCLQHVAQRTGKTVVVVCDQFEQFFTSHPERSDRAPFLRAVGDCVSDFRVPCKFVFLVREDQLGHLAEFDDYVPEPLEQRKRFYLPLFNAADAVRILRQLSDKADLGWTDAFIRTAVADLTMEGRVRPVELRLVGTALAMSGIDNDLDYACAGRAQGLLRDYIEMVLHSLSDRELSVQTMKRVLLALVAEPDGRLALSPEEIALRTGFKLNFVSRTLDRLAQANLVRLEICPAPRLPRYVGHF
jgi:hypothetical protein